MPARRAAPALAAALALAALARPALPAPDMTAVRLHGVLHGCVLRMEAHFKWAPRESVRAGVLGTIEASSRDFEAITVELGADRTVLTAPLRSGYEAYRVRVREARGEEQVADVKPDGSVVRLKNPFADVVYACAVKQVGRTAVWVRGEARKKEEAALLRLLKSVVAGVTQEGDDVDGWIGKEVKATWSRQGTDLLLVDDGTVDDASRAAVAKAVRDGHAVAKRLVSGSMPFPPVVRVTRNRELFGHLAGRRGLAEQDAVYVPEVAELLVSPRRAELDAAQVAGEGALQAAHFLLGTADAEPLWTGLRRQAVAAAEGAGAGGLLPDDASAALDRVRERKSTTWYRLMMLPTLTGFLREDADERAIDAELAAGYLASGSASVGKASLAAWIAALRKWGHPDAASAAAVSTMDGAKSDAEYWAFWGAKADPKKKPGK